VSARTTQTAARTGVIVAGIDAGASATTCVIADGAGRVLGLGRGGPIDHLFRPAGRRRTSVALKEAIGRAAQQARLRRPLNAIVAGLTGLEPHSPESRTAVRIIRGLIRAKIVVATWDAEVAFTGATAGQPGVMIIAGTGSVALGRNARGRTARAGGYGFLIDDAGGGVAVGQAALRAALRSSDGRGPKTRLAPMIQRRLGGWARIRRRVYGEGGGRPLLASLAPLVVAAARAGDPVARAILAEAGRSLAALAAAVARRLGMTRAPVPVYTVGGMFAAGRFVRAPMRRALRTAVPRAVLRPPRSVPVAGAVMMALEQAGAVADAAVCRRLARLRP